MAPKKRKRTNKAENKKKALREKQIVWKRVVGTGRNENNISCNNNNNTHIPLKFIEVIT